MKTKRIGLPQSFRAGNLGKVLHLSAFRVSRFWASLCMALSLVYAGSLTAQIANQMQHAPAKVAEHEHSLFGSVLSMQAKHHDEHFHAGESTGEQAPDHRVGGHHHHGDAGPSVMADATHDFAIVILFEGLRPAIPDRQVSRTPVAGPERPPRLVALAA